MGKNSETENNVTDSTATSIVQAGQTGPIHIGAGDQINAPTFTGDNRGVTIITGDNHGVTHQTF